MSSDGTSEGYAGDGLPTSDRMPIGSVRTSLGMYREQLKLVGGGQALQYIDILLDRAEEMENHIKECDCAKNTKESNTEPFKHLEAVDPINVMKMAVLVSEHVINSARDENLLNELELTALSLVLEMTKSNLDQIIIAAKSR